MVKGYQNSLVDQLKSFGWKFDKNGKLLGTVVGEKIVNHNLVAFFQMIKGGRSERWKK